MKKYKPLRYYPEPTIVFAEVPDEISLAISITGCPRRCPGCHSEYLWEYGGELLLENLDALIRKYIPHITCVCFMGGDAENPRELKKALKRIKRYGLKTALYSGADIKDVLYFDTHIAHVVNIPRSLYKYLDYVKYGPYDNALGGLDHPGTNQRMAMKDPLKKDQWLDITWRFQTKPEGLS